MSVEIQLGHLMELIAAIRGLGSKWDAEQYHFAVNEIAHTIITIK